jgi:hypothetical protein
MPVAIDLDYLSSRRDSDYVAIPVSGEYDRQSANRTEAS